MQPRALGDFTGTPLGMIGAESARGEAHGGMSELAVHPVAALFPMLSDDELDELAADIKANGLRFPIVHDKEGKTLIDGHNRVEGLRDRWRQAGVPQPRRRGPCGVYHIDKYKSHTECVDRAAPRLVKE